MPCRRRTGSGDPMQRQQSQLTPDSDPAGHCRGWNLQQERCPDSWALGLGTSWGWDGGWAQGRGQDWGWGCLGLEVGFGEMSSARAAVCGPLERAPAAAADDTGNSERMGCASVTCVWSCGPPSSERSDSSLREAYRSPC